MKTQSGCFGGSNSDETIDNIQEVTDLVDEITDPEVVSDETAANYQMALHYASMERRIRMLTWAVVFISAVLIIKEL